MEKINFFQEIATIPVSSKPKDDRNATFKSNNSGSNSHFG